MTPEAYFGVFAVVVAISLLVWSMRGLRSADLPWRLQKQVRSTLELDTGTAPGVPSSLTTTTPSAPSSQPVLDTLARGGRRITPSGTLTKLERQRQLAGLASSWSIEKLLAIKLTTLIVGTTLGVLIIVKKPTPLMFLVGGLCAVIGFHAPDLLLSIRGTKRQTEIAHELSDTLDQITICVEAGLGFDAAMARSARSGHGPIAEELRRVLQDLQVGVPRSQALDMLLQRTDVPDLKHFVITLSQADRYGVPIANILRVQSTEMREKRKAQAEEEAQKLPIKLLFPLILCVLPALFIVLMGPAIVRIAQSPLGGG